MKKVIRLTEDDLTRIVKQVINESSNEEDVKGKKCESCGKGTYKETESMDDLRGTLHCSKCDKMVDRYKKYTPFKKKSNKLSESDLVRLIERVINESEKNPTKSEILKMSKEELKDKYGVLKVKGTYLDEEGEFTHFKEVMGDVTCSFRYDKVTPSGFKKSTKGVKVKHDSVKFD